MKLFDPDPKLRWLFCMTHPDDEISICAWISRLTAQRNPVFLCWTHCTPEREAEARAVAEVLRVPAENLAFLDAPDGHACDHMARLAPDLSEVIEASAPDRIACGAFEQGHLDHDATNYLVNRLYDGPILEIPFYHTFAKRAQCLNRFANPAGQEVLHLTAEEQRLKKTVARQFPSQNIWTVLVWYEVWQATRLRRMELTKTERMRLQSHKDFRTPNLPEQLSAAVRVTASWRRWLRAVDEAERDLKERVRA